MSESGDGEEMRILKGTRDNISNAAQVVKKGGLVAYPTDTVYGLGCDPFNVMAVKRISKLKGERKKPLPILASSSRHVKRIATLSREAEKIANWFWPGPLTLVLPRKTILPEVVTCNLNSVGVRVPKHNVALDLIDLSDGLLVGTSANKTGEKPPRTAQDAAEQLGKELDLIIDSGPVPLGVPSTVVDLISKKPRILREGPIGLEEILDILSQG